MKTAHAVYIHGPSILLSRCSGLHPLQASNTDTESQNQMPCIPLKACTFSRDCFGAGGDANCVPECMYCASRSVLETYSVIDGKYRDPSLEQGGRMSESTLSVHLPFRLMSTTTYVGRTLTQKSKREIRLKKGQTDEPGDPHEELHPEPKHFVTFKPIFDASTNILATPVMKHQWIPLRYCMMHKAPAQLPKVTGLSVPQS